MMCPAGQRRKRYKPTRAVQARINQRNAEKKLEGILRRNFSEHGQTLTVTYHQGGEPADETQAQRDAQYYARRLKRLYRKAGIELKCLYATECGEGGGWRHSFVLTEGIDRAAIEKAWGKGDARFKSIEGAPDELAEISRRIAQGRRFYKRWSGSRNLEKPG